MSILFKTTVYGNDRYLGVHALGDKFVLCLVHDPQHAASLKKHNDGYIFEQYCIRNSCWECKEQGLILELCPKSCNGLSLVVIDNQLSIKDKFINIGFSFPKQGFSSISWTKQGGCTFSIH